MTDQFTYLKHRMDRLESRVDMLEKVVRPASSEDDEPLGPPPNREPQDHLKWAVPDASLRMLEATLWSIYDFVTNQSIGHTNDYKDVIEIKDSQTVVYQAVAEIRDDVQAILATLAEAR